MNESQGLLYSSYACNLSPRSKAKKNGNHGNDNLDFKGMVNGKNVISQSNMNPNDPKYVVEWLRDNNDKGKKNKNGKKRKSLKLKFGGNNKLKRKKKKDKKRSNSKPENVYPPSISLQDLQ